ncbi:MAG: hypothetical protein NZ518_11360, partial [Dehalococcoidia bacterium]|nr:hypothetical protein [Dehalococcoidia bacterium]
MIDANQHIWDPAWQPEPHKWMQAERAARRTFPPRDPATIRPRVGNGFMDKTGALNIKINDRLGFDMSIMHVV